MKNAVIIYTDGACKGNPGPGGWGAVLQWRGKQKEMFGGEPQTTNNRMEITAAVMAMESLKRGCEIVLYTDSVYVQKGVTEWLPKWRKNSAGRGLARREKGRLKPVKNADLWERLAAAAERHDVEWRRVKGHSGDAGNELADSLANRGVLSALQNNTKNAEEIQP